MQQHRIQVETCRRALILAQSDLGRCRQLMQDAAVQLIQGFCRQCLEKKKVMLIKKARVIQKAYRACDKTLFMRRKFEHKIMRLKEALALQQQFVQLNHNNAVYAHFFQYGWDNIRGDKIVCQLCSYQTPKKCANATIMLRSIYQHLKSCHCIHTDLRTNFDIRRFKNRYDHTISNKKELLQNLWNMDFV